MSQLLINASIDNRALGQKTGQDGVTVNTTGNAEDGGRYSIGTSEETITFSTKVGNAGYLTLYNNDSTNYVTWGPVAEGTLAHPFRILAGTPAVVGLVDGQASIFMKANTAACEVSWHVYEI